MGKSDTGRQGRTAHAVGTGTDDAGPAPDLDQVPGAQAGNAGTVTGSTGVRDQAVPAAWADAVDAGAAPDLSQAPGTAPGMAVTGTGSGIGGPAFAGAGYAPLMSVQGGEAPGGMQLPTTERMQDGGAAPEPQEGETS